MQTNKLLPSATIFLGAFLVFGVQPLIGRTLLPIFGGTAAVWVVCLCSFQLLLLAGYFYAHVLGGDPQRGVRGFKTHLALLFASAVWVCAVAFLKRDLLSWAGSGDAAAFEVLVAVLALVGVPYVLLSANSSMVQVLAGGDYRLYAVSNAGSLAGLMAYPFVFEPYVGLATQWLGFGVGMAIYALLLGLLARRQAAGAAGGRGCGATGPHDSAATERQGHSQAWWPWFAIPAVTCFLLNAVTTHLTLDVMPFPLLWVVLLALFLLSYVIGFSDRGAAFSRATGWAVPPLVLCAVLVFSAEVRGAMFFLDLLACLLLVFAGCTFLHGRLYSLRPDGSRLTRFYLFNALGGAVGGVLTGLVAPLVFDSILEYPIALVLVLGATAWGAASANRRVAVKAAFWVVLAGVAATLVWRIAFPSTRGRTILVKKRGFFGTVVVTEMKAKAGSGAEGKVHEFIHGNTVHGVQALIPGKERMPTAYYTPNASGFAIAGHPKYKNGEPMRVNITGLGVGVLFCYGRTNDYYRAYEISKDALDIATDTNLFTFVSDCPAKKDIILGDARKGLEAELAAGVEPYDVIVVDAFTGDNLPYHLSTTEAFDLYFKLLKPDGILCVNISNWHLSLQPFMRALGDRYEVPLLGILALPDLRTLSFGGMMAFFCPDPSKIGVPPFDDKTKFIDFRKFEPMRRLPTDEKGSFVELIQW
jgi:hypothetical protein